MSLIHWAIVAIVIFLLFGAGKLPRLMGDVAEGIKAFKKGMKEDGESTKKIDHVKNEKE
ncbi:MAG: twin-arginine translocase TatA/TatE family subunit [Alphaproteobacteria bacterium]|nr:twin-arginine translocase TatA/TatE family subunit [Alphaproteobacteria bacterium]